MTISPTGAAIWRDWETDGVPSSGAHLPIKPEIRKWAAQIEGGYGLAADFAKISEKVVFVEMFAGDDWPLVGNGVVDETAWIQEAGDVAAAAGGVLMLTPGKHRTTDRLYWTRPLAIQGIGSPAPYKIRADQSNLLSVAPADYYMGPWLYFDHTGVGLEIYGADGPIGQSRISNIGITRPQTVPAVGVPFTPVEQSWDIVIANAWALLTDNVIAGTCRGILHDYGGYGRLHIDGLQAQCLKQLIQITTSNDDCRIDRVAQGNIWCFHPEVVRYTLENLETIRLYRVDNPWIRDFFSIGHRRGIAIYTGSEGTVAKFKIDNADCDLGVTAIWVAPECNGVTGQISNLACQGPDADQMVANAGSMIEDHGTGTRIQIDSPLLTKAIDHAIDLAGTGAVITLDTPRIDVWDRDTDGASAIRVAAGNSLYIDGRLIAEGSSSPLFDIDASASLIYPDGKRAGTAALLAASTSVTVAHGQYLTPTFGQVRAGFAGNPYSSAKIWPSAITSSTITFTVDAAPGTDTSIWWEADVSVV